MRDGTDGSPIIGNSTSGTGYGSFSLYKPGYNGNEFNRSPSRFLTLHSNGGGSHFYPCSLKVTSRCAIGGLGQQGLALLR